MAKLTNNRRRSARLRIDRSIPVPIHVFPVLPFLGESIDANLLNISTGGMALLVSMIHPKLNIVRGTKIKVHFRLPGQPLFECTGEVTRNYKTENEDSLLGIRFTKINPCFISAIEAMSLAKGPEPMELALERFE